MRHPESCAVGRWGGLRPFIALAVMAAPLSAGAAAGDAAVAGALWSYDGKSGPSHWAALDPRYAACGSGRLQSPIDLPAGQPVAYTPLVFRYRSQPLAAVHTGTGVHVLSPPGSAVLVRGKAYDLEGFSFHVPGEHRFNGKVPGAELQLLHRDREGSILMVAVPLRSGGRENRILSRILDDLPSRPGERVHRRQVGINPLFLLPAQRSYFQYLGSLTVPPCTVPVEA